MTLANTVTPAHWAVEMSQLESPVDFDWAIELANSTAHSTHDWTVDWAV